MRRTRKQPEPEREKSLPDTLQGFLKEHALRMNAEGDQRRVMVSAAVAQSFLGLHQELSRAAMQGAALNAGAALTAGKSFEEAVDPDGMLDAVQFAYEFMAACSVLVLREATATVGGDVNAFPDLDAYVAAFKVKRWGEAKEEAAVN